MSGKTHTMMTPCSAWSVHAVMHKWQDPARESGKSLPPSHIFTGTLPVDTTLQETHPRASAHTPEVWH